MEFSHFRFHIESNHNVSCNRNSAISVSCQLHQKTFVMFNENSAIFIFMSNPTTTLSYKQNFSHFRFHDKRFLLVNLTWNGNGWISVNMTTLWLDLIWKIEMAEFPLTWRSLWLDLTWNELAEFGLNMRNV